MSQVKEDWDLPFEERYLNAAEAMDCLGHWLAVLGMGDNGHFQRLERDFVKHGATVVRGRRNAPK